MSMLALSAIAPLLVKPVMGAGSMLGYEIGLLFAVVAFQLLISSFLPVTSVATILDRYAFFLFAFVFTSIVVITAVSFMGEEDDDYAFKADFYAAGLFGVWC